MPTRSARPCNCPIRAPELQDWEELVDRFQHPEREVTIALVGKYIQLHDAYLSVVEALQHGGIAHRARVRIRWVQADDLTGPEADVDAVFEGVQGILVPGGFGNRGIEGKLARRPLRPRARHPLSGHLPGHADRGDGVRPPRLRPGGRVLHRV